MSEEWNEGEHEKIKLPKKWQLELIGGGPFDGHVEVRQGARPTILGFSDESGNGVHLYITNGPQDPEGLETVVSLAYEEFVPWANLARLCDD